jgi:transposase
MKSSRLSNYKVRKIVECFCVDIEASKAATILKLNRKTANRFYSIFRKAIFDYQTNSLAKIQGTVELDESYFGPRRIRGVANRFGRGTLKQPVFGILERGGRVYTEIVPNCKRATLRPIILGKVDPRSLIYSDKWQGYDGLVDVGYDKHIRINHDKFLANERGHVNGIESFWSFTKRRLSKFNGYKKNFHLHLKECEFRWGKDFLTMKKELFTVVKSYKYR